MKLPTTRNAYRSRGAHRQEIAATGHASCVCDVVANQRDPDAAAAAAAAALSTRALLIACHCIHCGKITVADSDVTDRKPHPS